MLFTADVNSSWLQVTRNHFSLRALVLWYRACRFHRRPSVETAVDRRLPPACNSSIVASISVIHLAMSTETSLNQAIKGAPPPGMRVSGPAPLPPLARASSDTVDAFIAQTSDPRPPSYPHLRPAPTIIQPATTDLSRL